MTTSRLIGFWTTFLTGEYTQDYLDFLPQKAVQQNLRHIKTFYQNTGEKTEKKFIQRPDKYLSKAEMDAFVEHATTVLMHVYTRLWNGDTPVPEGNSVLDALGLANIARTPEICEKSSHLSQKTG